MKKRIGIINSGGDCPALNTVIDAVVKTLDSEYEVIGFYRGFEGLLTGNYISLDRNYTSQHRWIGGTILKTTNKGNFPAKRSGGGKFSKKELEIIAKAFETYQKLELECLIVLGGDGSLFTAYSLQQFGFNMVGVPKSIDNDLSVTDFTFGFHTAVETANDAINRLHTTAASHDRVMILEVMGRSAGWIALYSGIAGGANMILIPEIPFSYKKIKKFLEKRHENLNTSTVIVVAEAANSVENGDSKLDFSTSNQEKGITETISQKIKNFVNKNTNLEARSVNMDHIIRGGSPIAFDKILATQMGAFAGLLAIEKKYGTMVAYKNNQIISVNLGDGVLAAKNVDPNSQIVKLAREIGTSFGD